MSNTSFILWKTSWNKMQPTNSIFICVSEANEEEEQRVPLAPVQQNGPPRPRLVSRDVEYSEEDHQKVSDYWIHDASHHSTDFERPVWKRTRMSTFPIQSIIATKSTREAMLTFNKKHREITISETLFNHASQTIPCQRSNLERPSTKLCQTKTQQVF